MHSVFKNASVFTGGKLVRLDFTVIDGRFDSFVPCAQVFSSDEFFDLKDMIVSPGLVDAHSHLRCPGFSYKENPRSGQSAAAAGGFLTVCAMPNLSPVPDSLVNLRAETDIFDSEPIIDVLPYGTITRGELGCELSDMEALAPFVCGFSDDGRGVQDDTVMEAAMKRAASLNKLIAAHCEDNSLLRGGYINDGAYARTHGHRGICSESEWGQIARDLALAARTGCAYHVCHVSSKESVALIREAKKAGLDVSCETTHHYLTLTEDDLCEDGRFKMNPPLRSAADREALIEGLLDGTIDIIATDHAPHSAEEKSRGLEGSAFGVSGFETAFAALNTYLVRRGVISYELLFDRLFTAPSRRFHAGHGLSPGADADFAVFDPSISYRLDPASFQSLGRSTPYDGREMTGRCAMTFRKGVKIHDQD